MGTSWRIRIDKLLDKGMAANGFRNMAPRYVGHRGYFVKEISPSIELVLHVWQYPQGGRASTELRTVVGVIHTELANLVMRLSGRSEQIYMPHKHWVAVENLRTLGGKGWWKFTDEQDRLVVAERIESFLDAINTFAMPFAEQFPTLAAVTSYMDIAPEMKKVCEIRDYKLIAAYILQHDYETAATILEEARQYQKDFETFYQNALAEIDRLAK